MLFTTFSLAAALASPFMTLRATPPRAAATLPAQLEWFDGPFTNALGKARSEDKPLLVYFWSDQSESCGRMYTETIQNPRSQSVLARNILVSANYNSDQGVQLFERFHVSVLPTLLLVNADGTPEDAIVGLIDVDGLLAEFERVQRNEGTVSGLRALAAAARPGSEQAIEASWKLAGKLADLGQQQAHDALLVSIRESDPKAKTVIGARAHLWKIRDDIRGSCAGEGEECTCEADAAAGKDGECPLCDAMVKADFAPLYAFAKKVKVDESRFEVWQTIGNMEARRSATEAAVKAFKSAAAVVPAEQAISFPKGVANWVVTSNSEQAYPAKVKKFALEMAEQSVKRARLLDPTSAGYADTYGETEPRFIQADCLAVLAFTLDLNGDAKGARKTAQQVLELSGSDDYREYLAPLLSEG